ncbi:hypothetical protein ABZ858_23980 [Streptomyces sp. NPDC047017]|uniref:hypothetical protein n=1 Tax=Streptomyces sp. NPDC047017 TaxID=3155024 RepID=UPI003405FEB0
MPSTTAPAHGAAPRAKSPSPAPPLAAGQLPDEAKAAWKPIGSPVRRPVGHHIGLDECAGLDGATAWLQQGWASAAGTPAIQDTFTFATSAAARHAFDQAGTGMKSCAMPLRALQSTNRLTPDASVARTATAGDASAWRYQWTAVPGMSAPGSQTHHVYLALQGSQLTALQYTDLASAGQTDTATPASDRAFLSTLAAQLRAHP